MKKVLLLLSFCVCSILYGTAQFVTIPDDAFKTFLVNKYPGCFNASGQLDTTCTAIVMEDSLKLPTSVPTGISYAALVYFDNLLYLDASLSGIGAPSTIRPAYLPATLKTFICNLSGQWSSSNPELLIDLMPAGLEHVEYTRSYVSDLSGKVWPAGLKYLELTDNELNASFGILPSTLDTLICRRQTVNPGVGSTLNTISDALPASLKYFDCSENSLMSFPVFPSTLSYLNCSFQFFMMGLGGMTPVPLVTALPASLPPNLKTFKCSSNGYSSIPDLPASLEYLDCSSQAYHVILEGTPWNFDGLSSLPVLPAGLKYLSCGYNIMSVLPALPTGLEFLSTGNNLLSSLPALPATLTGLDISSNTISSISSLPDGLNYLNVSNTNLSCLPHLPDAMAGQSAYISSQYNLIITSTNINCIPNFVGGIRLSASVPLCNETNNTNNCEINPVISGTVFYDNNSNGIQDIDELPRANVRVNYNSVHTFSDVNGHYEITGAIGNNTITIDAPAFYNAVPSTINHTIASANTVITDLVALQPVSLFDSVLVTITPGAALRNGFNVTYHIHYENMGTTSQVASLVIGFDNSLLSYVSSSTAVTAGPNNISLTTANMYPGYRGDFDLVFLVNASTGSGVLTTATITGGTSTGIDSTFDIIVGPMDPNDKHATPKLTPLQVNNGTFINYLVRFQNVGTASAINVYITDTLSALLQENTLEMVAASHPCKITQKGNKLFFHFENINLPDSNTNEPGSHGFIRFRIKAQPALLVNTVIPNKADIYFDFNAAVRTNTATTSIQLSVIPLSLLDFTGKLQANNKALLQWKTANENKVARFEIEQSLNGNTFNYATSETARGSGDNQYAKSLTLPASLVFYRLKMIDIDGNYNYSRVVKIAAEKIRSGIRLLNNPAHNHLNVQVNDPSLYNTKAILINGEGKTVLTFILSQQEQQVNISSLPAGMYYIKTVMGAEKLLIDR